MATRKTTRPVAPVKTPTPAQPVVSAAPAAAAKTRRAAAPRRAKAVAPAAPAAVATRPPTQEEIRVRAYFLSLERPSPAADPNADWLRAEQELAAGRVAVSDSMAGQA